MIQQMCSIVMADQNSSDLRSATQRTAIKARNCLLPGRVSASDWKIGKVDAVFLHFPLAINEEF
jgi:hypothetical protein